MPRIVAGVLIASGWEVRAEVSFNHFGERGVVDLVAWHAPTRTLLLVEPKTELADVNDLLAVTDRRRRLAAVIAAPYDWKPASVGQWVVVASSRTNARRLADHRTLLRSSFPADGRANSGWLANPSGPLSALSFLPDSRVAGARRTVATTKRVRLPKPNVGPRAEAA